MDKKELIKLLDEVFVPIGFKRVDNNWIFHNDTLSKLINLQKSNYSKSFYINYGFIIKGLELTTTTHIASRLASSNREEQKRITDLLDLETEIPIDQRSAELKKFIADKIVVAMQSVNTETDLLNELKRRPHLNDIPLVVKRHFNLPL